MESSSVFNCLVKQRHNTNNNGNRYNSKIPGILFAIIWFWRSGRFLIRYFKGKSDNNVNWDGISQSEMISGTEDTKDGSGSSKIGVELTRFFGTKCNMKCDQNCKHVQQIIERTGHAVTF